jgi:hypothetical protein
MSNRRTCVAASLSFLFCVRALAGEIIPTGTLEVWVSVSSSPDYVKEWTHTPSTHPIKITELKSMRAGQTAYIAFITSGHSVDENGYPDISVDLVIRKPDGSVLFERKEYAAIKYRTGAIGFAMADPALDLKLDPGDPTGTYQIEATAWDRRAKSRSTGSAKLTLEE